MDNKRAITEKTVPTRMYMKNSFSKSSVSKSPITNSVYVFIVINLWTLEKIEAVAIITTKTFILNIISKPVFEIIHHIHTLDALNFVRKNIESISSNPNQFEWKESITFVHRPKSILTCSVKTMLYASFAPLFNHTLHVYTYSFSIFFVEDPTECSISTELWYAKMGRLFWCE